MQQLGQNWRTMKLCFSSACVLAVALLPLQLSLVDANPNANIRGLKIDNDAVTIASACNEAANKQSCQGTTDEESQQACVWCECQAIPSECLTPNQAASVPPGVFDCDKDIDTDIDMKDIDMKDTHSHTFQFAQGVTHTLKGEAVQGDLCDDSSKSISGYMDVKGSKYDEDGEDKHLFYWMFEKRGTDEETKQPDSKDHHKDTDDETPFLVWLTGGPGCSSTLALLSENGPCSVNEDGTSTSVNPNSWTESAHVLWLDQPAGVGFSYGALTDSNEEMISEDAYFFLQAFFQAHPEYAKSPLYIVGESYGGHYAPAIAHRVWKGNEAHQDGTIYLNFAGLGVGNGLTDPQEQYKWYPEMAYNNSHHLKVVSEETYNTMKSIVPKCTYLIEKCNAGDSLVNTFACQTAFSVCNLGLTTPYQMTGLNPYDIRKQCGDNPLCYDFSHVEHWLNLPSTREALHVTKESGTWASCNMGINLKFHTDWMKDFSHYVADLLNAGFPVLIYAGDVDFICNYMGNRAWTLGLDWTYGEQFAEAGDHEWKSQGLARTYDNFTFLQVYDAGHMVPSDQPEVALDMITTFMTNGKF